MRQSSRHPISEPLSFVRNTVNIRIVTQSMKMPVTSPVFSYFVIRSTPRVSSLLYTWEYQLFRDADPYLYENAGHGHSLWVCNISGKTVDV